MAKLMFHVRHSAKPIQVGEVLQALHGQGRLSLEEILEIGRQRGYQIGTTVKSPQTVNDHPVREAKDLGLITESALSLTNLGQQMVDLLNHKPSVFSETMHVLHYALWIPSRKTSNCFSWSYRTTCDLLWESGSTIIDRGRLASEVSTLAMERFDTNEVSFSKDSVRGVLQWLSELDPPVLNTRQEANVFTRRTFCPPETFALAVDYLYRVEGADYQTNLLLDPDKQATICKVCLLDSTAFDASFEWAVGQYDFLKRGTRGGWGSYLLLTRQPRIIDFVG